MSANMPWLNPGCANELLALNQCYDNTQLMEQIISKVVCNLAATDTAFQACVRQAAWTGIVDGSVAPVGQVGEVMSSIPTTPVALVANTWTNVAMLSLTPGDWTAWGIASFPATIGLTSFGAGVDLATLTPPATAPAILNTTLLAEGGLAGTCPTPAAIYNVTAATNIALWAMSTVAMTPGPSVALYARRMR